MCLIVIIQFRRKRLRRISCDWFQQRASGLVLMTIGCVRYYGGLSRSEFILWLKNDWILIIQFRRKSLRRISCDWFQQRASGLVVMTIGCVRYYGGLSRSEFILWLKNDWILIIQFRRKRLRRISCDWFQQRASGLVVMTIGCVRCYGGLSRSEFILWFKNVWILIIQSREKG
jgi:succinate dehydrogenase hydrophobic anchor subunit